MPARSSCLAASENPSGRTRCRRQPVLAASRITLPVFGGISGSNNTISNIGSALSHPAKHVTVPPLGTVMQLDNNPELQAFVDQRLKQLQYEAVSIQRSAVRLDQSWHDRF